MNTKTGMLNKAGLDNYKEMFDHIPELVRKDIKKVFYDCFETNKSKKSHTYRDKNLGICICVQYTNACKLWRRDAVYKLADDMFVLFIRQYCLWRKETKWMQWDH